MKKIKEFMKEIIEKVIKRSKSKMFWAGIGAIILQISVLAGIDFKEITTWGMFFSNIAMVLSNPFLVISFLIEIIAFLNNPEDKEKF